MKVQSIPVFNREGHWFESSNSHNNQGVLQLHPFLCPVFIRNFFNFCVSMRMNFEPHSAWKISTVAVISVQSALFTPPAKRILLPATAAAIANLGKLSFATLHFPVFTL